MSLFYEARIGCFRPVTYLDRSEATVIRPLLYCDEALLRRAAAELELPVTKSRCPADGMTKRQEVKELVSELRGKYPDLREQILGAMQRYPLDGWQKTPRTANAG